MDYHRFTLAFSGEWVHLEPGFLAHHHRETLVRTRVVILAAILLYGIFGILDAVMVPAQVHLLWMIRYAVVIPSALAVLAFTFHRSYEKYSQPALFFMIFTGGLGIELMVMLADPPAKYSYYAGIILVIIVLHTAVGMRFAWATACSCTILAVYEIIAVGIINSPFHYLVSSNFFFISAVLLSMLAGYSIELNARRRFFSSHLLTLEKEKVQDANRDLDKRVRERTEELSRANQQLQNEMEQRLAAQEERLELEAALNQRQKSEALGTLAGGIAHDFNNILAAIMGYTELLMQDLDAGHEHQTFVNEILKATQRARDLTSQILTFSRQSEQAFKPFAITLVVKEALSLIKASVPPAITIETELAAQNWVVADPTQIHRVVMNLCTNSIQAMAGHGGSLKVTLGDIDLAAPFRAGDTEIPAGPYIRLKIEDTGMGMDKTVREKIFDPFFTTKGVNQGTGMGLSVVHGVIKKCNGGITVTSSPGKGSCFTIFLPAVAPEVKKAPEVRPAPPPRGDGEHILFVDDEPALVEIMKTALPSLGYRVTAVTSPREGLEVLKRKSMDIDLVITDFSMPGMDGMTFAREVLRQHPDLTVLLSTGYGESITREGLDQAGIRDMIMKPLTRSTLGEKIQEVISSRKKREE